MITRFSLLLAPSLLAVAHGAQIPDEIRPYVVFQDNPDRFYEFTQTDAINHLAAQGKVVVRRFAGKILDVGTAQGYLESFVEYGLTRREFRADLLAFLRAVVAREEGN